MPEHRVLSRLTPDNSLAVRKHKSQSIEDSNVLIRMSSVGICGTDLAMLSGKRAVQAEILGHEGVGKIAQAPEGWPIPVGTRVVINPVHRIRPGVVIGHSSDGVLREWFWLNANEADTGELLVRCPDGCTLEDTELVLAEPLGSVLYSLELLRRNSAGSGLLIRGSGTIGILAAVAWSRFMTTPVLLVAGSEEHAEWLSAFSNWPANVFICSTTNLQDTIREHSLASRLTAAILCSSRAEAPEGLRLLLDVLPDGATIDLMAGFPTEYKEGRIPEVNLDQVRWKNSCGTNFSPATTISDRVTNKSMFLLGHRGTAKRHILDAIQVLSSGAVSKSHLPHCFLTLEQLPEAVTNMLCNQRRHGMKFVKAIVDFSRDNLGKPVAYC
ncbi:MAG TPA: medium chain dehydrogenase/reductase family protein [Terriglobales bacterium]